MVLSKKEKQIKREELFMKQRKKKGISELTKDEIQKIRTKYLNKKTGPRPSPLGKVSHTVIDGCVWTN